VKRNTEENLVIIDNYLDSTYAEDILHRISVLNYTKIKLDNGIHYEFEYNINKIVDEIFNNIQFFNLVNRRLSTDITAIYEHHISKMTHGEYIDDHTDKGNKGQRATFLFYLNKNWTKENGGDLEFTENVLILPVFNRLVLFNNTEISTHRVNRLKTDKARYTITGWLYNDRNQDNN